MKTLADVLTAVEPLIAAHAADEYPREAVGIVFADGTIKRLINQARSEKRVVASADQVAAALDDSDSPMCFYHSHPRTAAVPSPADRKAMAEQASHASYVPLLIYGIDGLRVWVWHDGDAVEMEVA